MRSVAVMAAVSASLALAMPVAEPQGHTPAAGTLGGLNAGGVNRLSPSVPLDCGCVACPSTSATCAAYFNRCLLRCQQAKYMIEPELGDISRSHRGNGAGDRDERRAKEGLAQLDGDMSRSHRGNGAGDRDERRAKEGLAQLDGDMSRSHRGNGAGDRDGRRAKEGLAQFDGDMSRSHRGNGGGDRNGRLKDDGSYAPGFGQVNQAPPSPGPYSTDPSPIF